jgi:hypothetical protein
VELVVAGAKPALRAGRCAVRDRCGRKLDYDALVVRDADARFVPAQFALASENRIRIVVNDAGARYPLEIDPLITSAADTQIASDQASALLGWSVASAAT